MTGSFGGAAAVEPTPSIAAPPTHITARRAPAALSNQPTRDGHDPSVPPPGDPRSVGTPDALVIQFDAHLDLYNLADCKEELNHGNFLRHAEALPQVVNVGHRDLFLPDAAVREFYRAHVPAAELAIDPAPAVAALGEWGAGAERVLLDIDCDVFDPAYFPAVAHPQPLGLSPALLVKLVHAAWSDRVCGVALSEFDPGRDRDDQSLGTLVWLLEYLLLKRYE